MMKRIVIIGSRDSGTKNDPHVIADRLQAAGATVRLVFWEELVLSIRTGKVAVFANGEQLFVDRPDLVIALGWYKSGKKSIYRDVAYSIALYLERLGIEFWNREMLDQRSTTKLSCMMQLALEGLPVPATDFSLDAALVLGGRTLPFIAKAAAASRGRSNYLVTDEVARAALAQEDAPLLVQAFLPNDHDLRVVCFGGKPHMVLRRARAAGAETHLNNTSQGGSAVWLPLEEVPSELLTNSEKICNIMNREMAGIDFIPDSASPFGYSCLEVNAIPQLTSGHDSDRKLEMLIRAIA